MSERQLSADIRWENYRDTRCITLENDTLKVSYLPLGGRMVSFVDKRTQREYLVQQSGKTYKAGTYDGDYVSSAAGFDDMFPTILECFYPSFPWQGHRIPDHGEVWSLEWQYQVMEDCVHMDVNGIRLPYRLSKDIRFVGSDEVRVDYKVENLTHFDLQFLWAAHPMVLAEEGARLLVPPECTKAVSVVSEKERLGVYGTAINWPEHTGKDGQVMRLDILRTATAQASEKYYFAEKLSKGWCGLHFPSDDSTFLLTFPVAAVPYLGIWVSEGWWKGLEVVALEPCTAPFDYLNISRLYTQTSVLKGRGVYEWNLGIRSLIAGETWEKS